MFKHAKDLVPLPIVELITTNHELNNHVYTRQSQSLHTALSRNDAIFKHLHFIALDFGTTYLLKIQ